MLGSRTKLYFEPIASCLQNEGRNLNRSLFHDASDPSSLIRRLQKLLLNR
jgi:hypothetical protein